MIMVLSVLEVYLILIALALGGSAYLPLSNPQPWPGLTMHTKQSLNFSCIEAVLVSGTLTLTLLHVYWLDITVSLLCLS